jgi:hypothetical protein
MTLHSSATTSLGIPSAGVLTGKMTNNGGQDTSDTVFFQAIINLPASIRFLLVFGLSIHWRSSATRSADENPCSVVRLTF